MRRTSGDDRSRRRSPLPEGVRPAEWPLRSRAAWAGGVTGARAGVVTGAMNMAGQIGSFLTTVLFGYIVVAFESYDAPLVPIALMSVVGALAWL